MYLGNPLLPINITASGATDLIKKELEKRNWHEYELKPLKLFLVPYFLFNYHYYVEDAIDSKRTVKKTIHGILAVNGHKIVVREDYVELIKHSWKKSHSDIPKGEYDEKWCNIEKREQDEILQLKTAEYFNVPKSNVVVSSAKKFLLPLYMTTVIAGRKEYALTINAIDGKIEGISGVPNREKGYLEVTRETINELKTPSNWLKYSKEAIMMGAASVSSGSKDAKNSKGIVKKSVSFFESKGFLILLMALAVILILAGYFKMKLP